MIHVFCNKRGSGKTKALISLANETVTRVNGNVVYIDDDDRPLLQLHRRIRFIKTEDFDLKKQESFYGFLCGILSEDYDIDTIFIDGLFNIIEENLQSAAHLFYCIEKLSTKNNVDFYININGDKEMPDFIMKYVA
jgi:16S rRNA G966 N2-methylase RsmD